MLDTVRKANQRIFDSNMNNEYAPISGVKDFNVAATKLAYGAESPVIQENRVAGAFRFLL